MTLRKWNEWLDWFTYGVTALSSGLFFTLIIAAVISRTLGRPIQATEEISTLAFIWACFGGASLCYRRWQHIQFTYFLEKFTFSVQRRIGIFMRGLIGAFLFILFIKSLWMIYQLRFTTMPISSLPQVLIYVPVPLFSFAMFFYTLEFLETESKSQTAGSP